MYVLHKSNFFKRISGFLLFSMISVYQIAIGRKLTKSEKNKVIKIGNGAYFSMRVTAAT